MDGNCKSFITIKEILSTGKHPIKDEELAKLKERALELGATSAIVISPKDDLIFDDKVKLLCFNCKHYGTKHSCPSKIPDIDYEKAIRSFDKGIILIYKVDFKDKGEFDKVRVSSTNNLHKILLDLENISFHDGNHFSTSFIGGSCKLCPEGCAEKCRNPALTRIPLEATGVNVVESLKKFGVHLSFPVKDYNTLSRVGLFLSSK